MTPLHEGSAATLAALYRSGEATPLDVARSLVAHIARWEPRLQATWGYDPDALLDAAQVSTERWRRGAPRSPLDGVPATLKENIATAGMALPLGSAATTLVPAAEDAPPAARLREAGTLFVAKTTMPDYGMLSSGLSSFHQREGRLTRNPWNLALNPGGSSAGAAAAAAAGYGPLHLGTDIGGSIRLPAAWCGVVGFKPSLGRVPIKPPYAGRVAGPITRTVADAAAMMAPLARPDWRDAMSLPWQDIAWHQFEVDPHAWLRGKRIALLLDAGWGLAPTPEIVAAVQAAARRFEAAGAVVEPLAPFATREMADGIDRFWRVRSWLDLQALPPERRELVLPFIRTWAGAGERCSTAQLFHGYSQMGALRDAAVAACQPFDAVLSPVAPVSGFPADWAMPTNDPARAMEHIAFTLPYNMSEQPAISVPCTMDSEGRPIGLQIACRRHEDLATLHFARAWELLRDPLPPWPQPPA